MTTPVTTAPPRRFQAILRLSAAPLLLAVAGGVLAGFLFNGVLERAIVRRTEASAFALLGRVGPDVESVLASGQDPKETIARLGRQLSLRATLIAADGRVLGDSAVDPGRLGSLENHADRPEVREARRNGTGVNTRYSSTVADRLVYAAARLRGGEVLRLAFPERDLSAWESPFRRQTLGLSVLAGLLVAALLVRARTRHASELDLVRKAIAGAGRGERPPNPGAVSEETAAVFSALGDLADLAAERAAGSRREAAVSRAVFEHVPVGILVVDADLSLLHANEEAVRLLGAAPGTARAGRHVLELAREKSSVDLLRAALATGHGTAPLTPPSAGEGRGLDASAFRVEDGASPGRPAAVVILREAGPLRTC